MPQNEQTDEVSYHPEENVIEQRASTIIIAEILLRPDQIKHFKADLETLQKSYLNM